MQTAQVGDRVQVHDAKRFRDGSVASPRGRAPLELTVALDHPRLPGLRLAALDLEVELISIQAQEAYSPAQESRTGRSSR
jgi:hypothetical protein